MTPAPVAVVTPVYRNGPTLEELTTRLATALDAAGLPWTLRFVVDGCPDGSLAVASALAAGDGRLHLTALTRNVGQHRALLAGLAASEPATAWVCLDADLQDPPEAVPLLVARLAVGDVSAVFAGRRGAYERTGRLLTGRLHRAVLARMTGVPADAGAFVALDAAARRALLRVQPPSIVAGIGAAGIRATSIPVARDRRPTGDSAWTATARLGQSARSLAWAWRRTGRLGALDGEHDGGHVVGERPPHVGDHGVLERSGHRRCAGDA